MSSVEKRGKREEGERGFCPVAPFLAATNTTGEAGRGVFELSRKLNLRTSQTTHDLLPALQLAAVYAPGHFGCPVELLRAGSSRPSPVQQTPFWQKARRSAPDKAEGRVSCRALLHALCAPFAESRAVAPVHCQGEDSGHAERLKSIINKKLIYNPKHRTQGSSVGFKNPQTALSLRHGALHKTWVHFEIANFPFLVPFVDDLFDIGKILHEFVPHLNELLAQVRRHVLEQVREVLEGSGPVQNMIWPEQHVQRIRVRGDRPGT